MQKLFLVQCPISDNVLAYLLHAICITCQISRTTMEITMFIAFITISLSASDL